jgi:diguanylate cyclase (GGDEF)-like protein
VLDLSAKPNLAGQAAGQDLAGQAAAKLAANADGILFLQELYQRAARIPVVVIIDHNSEINRVTLARLGVRCILQKSSLDSLLTIVNQILSRAQTTEAKILILDDDLIVLKLLRALLETWGLQVTTLNNPAQLCSMLAAVQPDLLILDVQMPEVDGIELCRQLRDLVEWAWLPIVFLTGSKDNETMQQIFSAGGDDYVTKPVVAPELITRILNRLERTRLLRCQTEVDLLTQLPNRYRASQDLTQLLQQAEQHQRIFCLAVLEIEHLKQINYQFGHSMGDRLMRQIAQQLRQAFRPNDLVARWDGAEFVIGISDLSAAEGKIWLDLIKQDFQDIIKTELKKTDQITDLNTKNSTNQVSKLEYELEYKIGASQYPTDGTDLESLYRVAALRAARQTSRGRL